MPLQALAKGIWVITSVVTLVAYLLGPVSSGLGWRWHGSCRAT